MPKKIDFDEDEEMPPLPPPPPPRQRRPRAPPVQPLPPHPTGYPQQLPDMPPQYPPQQPRPQMQYAQPQQAPRLVKRYSAFSQQAAEGIIDNETKEVLATDLWAAIADIVERLERIERSIGSMIG